MILVYAVIILVIAAILFRRDLSAIGQISFRGGWKLAVTIVALFPLQAATVTFVSGQTVFQMAILILSQVALVLLFLLNHHIPGVKIFALGIFLNTAVMVANGGWMPVTPETAQFVQPNQTIEIETKPSHSKNIVLTRSETNLWILSDIIRVTLPWRRNAVSIGDLLLIIGAGQFIFLASSKKKEIRRAVHQPLEEI